RRVPFAERAGPEPLRPARWPARRETGRVRHEVPARAAPLQPVGGARASDALPVDHRGGESGDENDPCEKGPHAFFRRRCEKKGYGPFPGRSHTRQLTREGGGDVIS